MQLKSESKHFSPARMTISTSGGKREAHLLTASLILLFILFLFTLPPVLLATDIPTLVGPPGLGSAQITIFSSFSRLPPSSTLLNSLLFLSVSMRYALNLFLPFSLLLLSIARPARVLILLRNPWFFFLFLVFG